MAIAATTVSAAYQAAAKMGASEAATSGAQGVGNNFAQMLDDAVKSAAGSMRAGESAALNGVSGSGDIVNVVNAVNSAELTLDTVVAIRDKVIGAYQDILKMPI